MSSEIEVSSSFQSESSSLTLQSRRTSPIHNYTRKPVGDEPKRDEKDNLLYYCKWDHRSYSSTNGLWVHLKSEHGIEKPTASRTKSDIAEENINQQYQALVEKGETEGLKALDDDVLERSINQKLVDLALLDLIIVRRLPFSIVEWDEFHQFCKALNRKSPSHIPSSHNTITSRIKDHFPECQDIVRKVLQSSRTKLHLAVDIWTSPNSYLYLAVCASFVDKEDSFQNLLIGLRTVCGHSGLQQWEVLLPILREYGVERDIGAVVGDNASTNGTLCRTIQEYLNKEHKINWLHTHQRIRCQGHILNLVVQAFLFQNEEEQKRLDSYDQEEEDGIEVDEKEKKKRETNLRNSMGVMGKLHNLVVHIRGSANRTQWFIDIAKRRIPLDNRTRWNSWYLMLSTALEDNVQNAINKYTQKWSQEENGGLDKKDTLSTSNWIELRMIAEFLEAFKGATDYMQGRQATLERVLESLEILGDYFDESLNMGKKYSKDLQNRITRAYEKFKTYSYKVETSPLYAAARIFAPQLRTEWLKDIIDGQEIWKEDGKTTFKRVEALWRQHIADLPASAIRSSENESSKKESKTEKLDRFQQLRRKHYESRRPQSQDEFENYCSETPSYGLEVTPLEWWMQGQQQKRWPRLSLLALEVLSIPGMSDKPERVFSGARRMISWERSRLEPEVVERTECLKDWKESGILSYEF
jgi:hypothetical protein